MKELNVAELRALIRLIAPLRALRADIEKSLHLEFYGGTGDLAVSSLEALRDQIGELTQDNYVRSLQVTFRQDAKDKTKFSQVLLVSGQLLAYLEAITGTGGLAGDPAEYSVQTAPNISLNMGDVHGAEMDQVMAIINKALRGLPGSVRPPKPPKAPKPPKVKRDMRYYVEDDDEDVIEIDDDDDDE